MEYHIGQRLSYEGKLCTVRYHGKIHGKDGRWLGVEWDDETIGKHDGILSGHRYFLCLSPSPTAASFIRPSRKADTSISLLQAVLEKYANPGNLHQAIQISGKTVEEVGFEKIQEQIQDVQELKTIILDKRCISFERSGSGSEKQIGDLYDLQLKVQELNLSHNVLETWKGVMKLCSPLRFLKSLDVSGNRFSDDDESLLAEESHEIILPLTSLKADETLLDWIVNIVGALPALNQLNLSRNSISRVSTALRGPKLAELDLSFNCIDSFEELASLSHLSRLSHLSLRGNPIREITYQSNVEFRSLTHLDLANTQLIDLKTLDNAPKTFPSLNWLLTKETPLSKLPSATLLTIARIPKLVVLNHVKISSEERQNAEIYYLGTIAKELEQVSDAEGDAKVLRSHQRWKDLCSIHGAPEIKKPIADAVDPDTLEARTTNFTFYILKSGCQKAYQNFDRREIARRGNQISDAKFKPPQNLADGRDDSLARTQDSPEERIASETQSRRSSRSSPVSTTEDIPPNSTKFEDIRYSPTGDKERPLNTAREDEIIEKTKLVPRTVSNYALQGIVGRLFALPPPFTTTIRLFLEFDEWVASSYLSSFTSATKKGNLTSSVVTAAGDGEKGDGDEESDNDSGWSLSQDDDEVYNDAQAWLKRRREREKEKGKWVRRSVELERSIKGVGDFVSWKGYEVGKEVRVKVMIV